MKEIISTKNETVKLLKSLGLKKGRNQSGLFLAEGEKLVKEAILNVPGAVKIIAVQREFADAFKYPAGCEVIIAPRPVIESVSGQRCPQGAVAAVEIAGLPRASGGCAVVLDGVSDPLNAGAIIRSADAFGYGRVILSPGCADVLAPKAVRASMGSIFHIPVETCASLEEAYSGLKEADYHILATHLKGEDRAEVGAKHALVIGSEARGVSKTTQDHAHALLRIPMRGKADSLNAAVAAGVAMYICQCCQNGAGRI